MRIKNFTINKYGPISETGNIPLGDFNLLYGNNENGKTLTIDALIKFLIGKKSKEFKQAGRVESDPNGYVTLSFRDNAPDKVIPEDGDLLKISASMPSGLGPSDFKNIFIIRNSDLSISNEAGYYTDITEKLVGLRTSDIKKIRKNLLELGNITEGFNFKDDEKSSKLKSRLGGAARLLEDIGNLKENLLSEEYDRLEIDLFNKKSELTKVDSALEEYDNARNREKYENCSKSYSELRKRINELSGLEVIEEKDYQAWQEKEKETGRVKKEIMEQREKKDTLVAAISQMEEKMSDAVMSQSSMERKKGLLDNEKHAINNLKEQLLKTTSSAPLKILLKRASYISSAISALLLSLGWLLKDITYLFSAGIILTAITLALWIAEITMTLKERKIDKAIKGLRLKLAELGIRASTYDDMLFSIRAFDDEYEKTVKKIGEYKTVIDARKRELDNVEKIITSLNKTIDSCEKEIISIKSKSGLNDIGEYSNALRIKKEKEKQKDTIASWLRGQLSLQDREADAEIDLIEEKLKELEVYSNSGKGIRYDRDKFISLKNEKEKIENEIINLNQKIKIYSEEMWEIERRVNELAVESEERLFCRTLVDMEAIINWINDFISVHNKKREISMQASAILDEIELDEKERVLELFEKDAPVSVSAIFSKITNGLYDEVVYRRDTGAISVKPTEGGEIEADKLSGGAYDQLYLAVRLALGEKLLKNEKGFFIMDDPFIKSDIHRIEEQMNVLKKISEEGWQIIYFSAKKEIRDILSSDIKKGKINYTEIKWLDRERTLF